jgi:hypothetical protein
LLPGLYVLFYFVEGREEALVASMELGLDSLLVFQSQYFFVYLLEFQDDVKLALARVYHVEKAVELSHFTHGGANHDIITLAHMLVDKVIERVLNDFFDLSIKVGPIVRSIHLNIWRGIQHNGWLYWCAETVT